MKHQTVKEQLNNFWKANVFTRFFIWSIGFALFIFSLAWIIVANSGFSTFDALFQPIRILLGVKDPTLYGRLFLIPAGALFCTIAIIINYRREKTFRIDYFLAYIPIIFTGFVFDEILKIPLFNDNLIRNIAHDWPFIDNPISFVVGLISTITFSFGVGIMGGSKFMPNNYAIAVDEVSKKLKIKYIHMQWIFDAMFVSIGFIISVINIYTKRVDDSTIVSWPSTLHYVGIVTVLFLLVQGTFIHLGIKVSDKIILNLSKRYKRRGK